MLIPPYTPYMTRRQQSLDVLATLEHAMLALDMAADIPTPECPASPMYADLKQASGIWTAELLSMLTAYMREELEGNI